jgi:ABC-2 type transport system ATP-binding protein
MRSAAALTLESLSKRFGRFVAVDGLSLAVEPGTMAGFLGPNGAGKSTTLYMIPRLVRPSGGCIRLFGLDIWKDYKRAIRNVGITVESPAFCDYLTGRQNLELAARMLGGVSATEIDRTLERVALADRQHDRVRVFSTGMRQRLGIARATLGRPRLLVLDEPTNGMDPEATQEILSFLRKEVREQGLTVFVSSHLMSEIEEFCDTVFVINRGRLVASGNVRELLAPHERMVRVSFLDQPPAIEVLRALPQVRQVETVSPDTFDFSLADGDSAWLNRCLLERGLKVSAVMPKKKTLKEFFLSLTGSRNGGEAAGQSAAGQGRNGGKGE